MTRLKVAGEIFIVANTVFTARIVTDCNRLWHAPTKFEESSDLSLTYILNDTFETNIAGKLNVEKLYQYTNTSHNFD